MGLLLIIGRFRESREYKNHLWRKNKALSRPIYTAIISRSKVKQDSKISLDLSVSTTIRQREERKS